MDNQQPDMTVVDEWLSTVGKANNPPKDEWLSTTVPKKESPDEWVTPVSPKESAEIKQAQDIIKGVGAPLNSDTLLAAKEIANRNNFDTFAKTMQNNFDQVSTMKFLLTPVGQHYAELGTEIAKQMDISGRVMKAAGVPKHWNIPDVVFPIGNGEIHVNSKYPAYVSDLIKASGGDISKTQDSLAMSMFLDQLLFSGLGKVANAVTQAIRFPKMAKLNPDIIKTMSPEGLESLNQELIRAEEEAALKTRPITPINDQARKEGSEIAAINRDLDTLANTPEGMEKISGKIDANQTIFNGVKYVTKIGDSGIEITPIKMASQEDKVEDIYRATYSISKELQELVKPNMVKKASDVLPPPAQASWWDKTKSIFGFYRSPQYLFRGVFDEVQAHQTLRDNLSTTFVDRISEWKKLEGTPLGKKVGEVLDHFKGYEKYLDPSNSEFIGDEGLRAVKAFREGFNYIADKAGIPKNQRITNYLTHVWDEVKDTELPVDANLQMWVDANKTHLLKREGLPNYVLDAVKAYKVYSKWAGNFIATTEFEPKIFSAVESLKEMNPIAGRYSHFYALNYFGKLQSSVPMWKELSKFSDFVGKTASDSLIALNIPTGVLNLTQAPVLGAPEIGYVAYSKGLNLAREAFFGNETTNAMAAYAKRLWKYSGFASDESTQVLKEGRTIFQWAMQKAGVPLDFIQKIDNIAYMHMHLSEALNKASIYMGAYDKAMTSAKLVMDNPGKYKGLEKWLKFRDVDVTKDIQDQVHKWAKYITIKSQQDFSRAGQSFIQAFPGIAPFTRIIGFSIKAGDQIVHNAAATIKYLGLTATNPGKYLDHFLYQPETMATIRFATASTLGTWLVKGTGLSLDRVFGIKNYIPLSIPIITVANRVFQGLEAIVHKDPRLELKVAKAIASFTGLYGVPVWKLQKMIEVADYNKGNHDMWNIPDSTGLKTIAKAEPGMFITTMLSPTELEDSTAYYDFIKERMSNLETIKNVGISVKLAQRDQDWRKMQLKQEQYKMLKTEENKFERQFKYENPEYRPNKGKLKKHY